MIKSLSLRNFMSYTSADIPLSSGVNFICGPNGSGKSTILIAISLALGLSHTERGRRLSDLIRWGADRSSIRLVLNNEPRNGSRPFPDFDTDDLVIERTLTKAGSYPTKIDGVPSTKEELTALIGGQGINPNNMLIIMQQDMVEEFSLLSPSDKLSMLEEVIEFQSYRRDLLQAREDLEALLGEEKQTRRILDGSGRRVTEWERLYEKYQRKRKLEDDLEGLTAEALWAKVVESERMVHQLDSRKGERNQELDHITKRLNELDKRIEERSGQVEEAWTGLESRKKQLVEAVGQQAQAQTRKDLYRSRLEQERNEMGILSNSADKDRSEIELVMSRLQESEDSEGIEDEEARLGADLAEAKREFLEIASGRKIIEAERTIASGKAKIVELEGLISSTKDRLTNPYGNELASAAEEVHSIPGLEKEVYGPLYSCIESDDLSIDVIRILLGDRMMRSFVTTTESDRAKVTNFLESRGLDSRVYLVPDSALVLIEDKYLPEDDGVLDWAVERIKAPKHVMALLHRAAGGVLLVRSDLSVGELAESLNTPVINREGKQAGRVEGMIHHVGGKVRGEGKGLEKELDRLTQSYSKLKEEISRQSEELEAARQQRIKDMESIQDRMLSIFSRMELLRADKVPRDILLRREADRIQTRSGALAEYKEKMMRDKERRIQQLQRELESEEKVASRSKTEVSRSDHQYQRARERLERQLKAYYGLESKRLVLVDQTRSTKAAIRDIDYRISRRREEVESLTQNAEELSPRISSPRDLLELEKEISNLRGSLSELNDVPDDIEGVYKMYLSEFENLRRSLESIIERREEMQAELKKGLDRWREIMNKHLDGINRDFNEILSEIGGRGRVELVNTDVRKVGLDILVGFEGKEMTSISTLTQSGGEKSLSTMAFLLALQRQVKSPFRAVDEYDVHLDPMNRDRVTQLLKSAVRGDSKQYIAITPSQISRRDLEEAENVVVVQSVEGRSRVGSLVLEVAA